MFRRINHSKIKYPYTLVGWPWSGEETLMYTKKGYYSTCYGLWIHSVCLYWPGIRHKQARNPQENRLWEPVRFDYKAPPQGTRKDSTFIGELFKQRSHIKVQGKESNMETGIRPAFSVESFLCKHQININILGWGALAAAESWKGRWSKCFLEVATNSTIESIEARSWVIKVSREEAEPHHQQRTGLNFGGSHHCR